MLEEIKEKYLDFHDGKIYNILLYEIDFINNIEIIINCVNFKNNNQFEKIKLLFHDVIFYNLNYKKGDGVFFLFETFYEKKNELITFDFDCDSIGENLLKVNPNSRLIIKCKEIDYQIIE